jgi:hypothetical protein
MTTARLAGVDLPDFGMPNAVPEIPAATYGARLEAHSCSARAAP